MKGKDKEFVWVCYGCYATGKVTLTAAEVARYPGRADQEELAQVRAMRAHHATNNHHPDTDTMIGVHPYRKLDDDLMAEHDRMHARIMTLKHVVNGRWVPVKK